MEVNIMREITMKEKYQDFNLLAVYPFTAESGIGILKVVDDFCFITCYYIGDKKLDIRKNKSYMTSGQMYFRKYGKRYYITDFMRV